MESACLRGRWVYVFAYCAAVLLPAVPQAMAQPEGGNDQLGRAEFMHGREAYDAGNYEEALESFQRALDLTGRSQLYYNIALAHDRLRQDQEALTAYEAYLEQTENPPHQEVVGRRIEALRRALAERNAVREAEQRVVAEERARLEAERARAEEALRLAELEAAEGGSDTGLWIGVIGGGVAAVGAAVVLVVVLSGGEATFDQGNFGSVTFAQRSGPPQVAVASW